MVPDRRVPEGSPPDNAGAGKSIERDALQGSAACAPPACTRIAPGRAQSRSSEQTAPRIRRSGALSSASLRGARGCRWDIRGGRRRRWSTHGRGGGWSTHGWGAAAGRSAHGRSAGAGRRAPGRSAGAGRRVARDDRAAERGRHGQGEQDSLDHDRGIPPLPGRRRVRCLVWPGRPRVAGATTRVDRTQRSLTTAPSPRPERFQWAVIRSRRAGRSADGSLPPAWVQLG